LLNLQQLRFSSRNPSDAFNIMLNIPLPSAILLWLTVLCVLGPLTYFALQAHNSQI